MEAAAAVHKWVRGGVGARGNEEANKYYVPGGNFRKSR